MNLVSELDLPAFDYTAGQLAHAVRLFAEHPQLPIIWPGSSEMSPNHGPAPDVS